MESLLHIALSNAVAAAVLALLAGAAARLPQRPDGSRSPASAA